MPELSTEEKRISINWDKYGHLYKVINVSAKTTLLNEGDVSRYGYLETASGSASIW